MDLKNTFGELVDKLRKARPVIHEITNYVTAKAVQMLRWQQALLL